MRRIKELDAIRGLAAIAIVVFHLGPPSLVWMGYGVNLFFVLSGYLITTIILGHETSTRFLFAFYARRALRIWPIYYASLLAVVAVALIRQSPGVSLNDLPYYLTFTQEIRQWLGGEETAFPIAFRHTWTLAIEEQFYLFWPALLGVVGRRGLPYASLILIASSLTARWLGTDLFVLASHTDSLALGGLLAGLLDQRDQTPEFSTRLDQRLTFVTLSAFSGYFLFLMAARLGTGVSSFFSKEMIAAFKPFCVNLAFFGLVGLIVRHSGSKSLSLLRTRGLVYLGTISYGIYLYHHIIIKYVEEYLAATGRAPTFGVAMAEFVASFVLAALSWEFVERPILVLKDRFRYDAVTTGEARQSLGTRDLMAAELG